MLQRLRMRDDEASMKYSFSWEASGPGERSLRRMEAFRKVVEGCSLLDIGFKGPRYIFFKPKNESARV